jgi:hypothetical protein
LSHFKLIAELEQSEEIGAGHLSPAGVSTIIQRQHLGGTQATIIKQPRSTAQSRSHTVKHANCFDNKNVNYDALLSHASICLEDLNKNSAIMMGGNMIQNTPSSINLVAMNLDMFFCYNALKVSDVVMVISSISIILFSLVCRRYECSLRM